MDLSVWMASATKSSPFCPPGLVVGSQDQFEVCGVDGAGVPLTADRVWPIACLTKLALADLAVKTLDLNRPITRWLPDVSIAPTVRELLTHTAGLPLDLESARYGAIGALGGQLKTRH